MASEAYILDGSGRLIHARGTNFLLNSGLRLSRWSYWEIESGFSRYVFKSPEMKNDKRAHLRPGRVAMARRQAEAAGQASRSSPVREAYSALVTFSVQDGPGKHQYAFAQVKHHLEWSAASRQVRIALASVNPIRVPVRLKCSARASGSRRFCALTGACGLVFIRSSPDISTTRRLLSDGSFCVLSFFEL